MSARTEFSYEQHGTRRCQRAPWALFDQERLSAPGKRGRAVVLYVQLRAEQSIGSLRPRGVNGLEVPAIYRFSNSHTHHHRFNDQGFLQ